MKRIALIAMLVLATGCAKNAERTDTKGVGEFQVETLFTHDGCTVYRFHDIRYRYFVKCENGDASTTSSYSVQSGKTTTVVDDEISTETVE